MAPQVSSREILDGLAVSAAGLAVGTTAKSSGQILGSNDRLDIAVIGLHGRGYAHLAALKAYRDAARISRVRDVGSNILIKFSDVTEEGLNAPISMGNIAVTMLQASSIAREVNRDLYFDTKDGKIQGGPEAMMLSRQEYEKGWAPHV